MEGATLIHAHLEGAELGSARLEKVSLIGAHLEGVYLRKAHLERAKLYNAHLERANLAETHLEGTGLSKAHLEGTDLRNAHLEGTDLRNAWMDKATLLNEAALDRASLDQTTFDNTNLSVVDWKKVPILGDEVTAQTAKDATGKRKSRQQRITDYQAAVRAYRRLAVALQANGLSAESANYLYRASIMERRLARHERRFGAYFFSVLLAVLAGYGYRLGRIVFAYLSVVLFFAALFLGARYLGGGAIDVTQVTDSLQISLNAIHGRVFFVQFGLDTAQSWIATIESVVGILIEGVFVAMLIQRFFGK
ncbi:MAG TPA: pentapeptide repeat-containing protein [Ktedonobacterales bacterium]